MPFTPMTGLELPDDAATVWRYMDLWKFQKLLETSSLFFVRSDRFSDPWDSVLPPKWRDKMQRAMCNSPNGGKYTEAAWYEEREITTNPICCWNCDENESERMWREYTSDTDALVIRSTIGRFKECFFSTPLQVRIGRVNYGYHDDLGSPQFVITWWGDDAPAAGLNPWYVPRYLKRMKFEYEKEIRATIHVNPEDQPIDSGFNLEIGSLGICTLIEAIHVHPNATTDQRKQLKSLMDKYGFRDIPIKASTLNLYSRII
jgi:hypothetical protein